MIIMGEHNAGREKYLRFMVKCWVRDGFETKSFTETRQGRAITMSKVGWKYLPLHSIILGAINKKILDCYRDLAIMIKWGGCPSPLGSL